MPSKPTIPEGPAYRAAWAGLDRATRRRITRAVNRSEPLGTRKEAAIAVGFARAQQRFWRRGWLFGPVVALLTQWGQQWIVILANVAVATLLFLGVALFFTRRARVAEARNLAVVEGKGKRRRR
jgi:hypothetical protein